MALLKADFTRSGAYAPDTVQFLLTIVACGLYSARCSRRRKTVYDLHDIKLPVAEIAVGFKKACFK